MWTRNRNRLPSTAPGGAGRSARRSCSSLRWWPIVGRAERITMRRSVRVRRIIGSDELDRTQPDWQDPHSRLPALPASRDSMLVVKRAKSPPCCTGTGRRRSTTNPHSAIESRRHVRRRACLPERDEVDLAAVGRRRLTTALQSPTKRGSSRGGCRIVKRRLDPRLPKAAMRAGDRARLSRDRRNDQVRGKGCDRLQRGDFADAWQTCRAQINLCKPFNRRGRSSGQATVPHGRSRRMTMSNVERLLAQGEAADEDLARMQSSVRRRRPTSDLRLPLRPLRSGGVRPQICDDAHRRQTEPPKPMFKKLWMGRGIRSTQIRW